MDQKCSKRLNMLVSCSQVFNLSPFSTKIGIAPPYKRSKSRNGLNTSQFKDIASHLGTLARRPYSRTRP